MFKSLVRTGLAGLLALSALAHAAASAPDSLRIGYQIYDIETGKRTTTGYTLQVAVDATTQEMCFVSPQVLFDKTGVSL